jgi:hypothetical protein
VVVVKRRELKGKRGKEESSDARERKEEKKV